MFGLLLLRQAARETLPSWLKSNLPAALRHLAAHEKVIPLRLTWLIAQQLARHGGADTLGLARVRDRLLALLFEEGMRPERDLPSFLRFAGSKDAVQLRTAREQSMQLYNDVHRWIDKSLKSGHSPNGDAGGTLAYTNLLFAYGMTRFSEANTVENLIHQAEKILESQTLGSDRRIAGDFLLAAFRYRIEQALEGKPNVGSLPDSLLATAKKIEDAAKQGTVQSNPTAGAEYAISRLREQLWVLEPQEKLDAYHTRIGQHDPVRQACADLHKLNDAAKFITTVRSLLQGKSTPLVKLNKTLTAQDRLLLMTDSLRLATRGGEQFAIELLSQVPAIMTATSRGKELVADPARKQGQLLEAAMKIAAHYDRIDLVEQLGQQFLELVKAKTGNDRHELINVAATECLRGLRKYDLSDAIDRFLRQMHRLILNQQTPEELRKTITKPEDWSKALQSLLHLAGGWLAYGMSQQTTTILQLGRDELLDDETKLQPKYYVALAQAYIAALGQGTAEEGLPRIRELFQKMPVNRVSNSFTSSKFYSRYHLNIAETTVLAMIGDHFIPGAGIHQLLEEDEFIVRRRIHHDMRQHLGQSGL